MKFTYLFDGERKIKQTTQEKKGKSMCIHQCYLFVNREKEGQQKKS